MNVWGRGPAEGDGDSDPRTSLMCVKMLKFPVGGTHPGRKRPVREE